MVKQLSRKEVILINRILKLFIERKLKDAGKSLEKLELTLTDKEWNKGYFNALQGMSLSLKSKDSRYIYLNQIPTDDSKKIDKWTKERNYWLAVQSTIQNWPQKGNNIKDEKNKT